LAAREVFEAATLKPLHKILLTRHEIDVAAHRGDWKAENGEATVVFPVLPEVAVDTLIRGRKTPLLRLLDS
jgi:hypothetical protein